MKTQTEKNWAVALHLSPFAGALIPLAGLVAPIAIWFSKRGQSQYIDRQGKEVMNFLISESVVGVGVILLALMLPYLRQIGGASGSLVDFVLPLTLFLAVLPVAVLGIVLPIMAAVKCANGDEFRYPFIVRLVK